jgi:hypothetical protein
MTLTIPARQKAIRCGVMFFMHKNRLVEHAQIWTAGKRYPVIENALSSSAAGSYMWNYWKTALLETVSRQNSIRVQNEHDSTARRSF